MRLCLIQLSLPNREHVLFEGYDFSYKLEKNGKELVSIYFHLQNMHEQFQTINFR